MNANVTPKTMSIAVIGLGRWGPNHVRNFQAMNDAEVVAAVDTDETRRTRIKAMYPDVEVLDAYETALDRDDIDAVVVATPTATHYDIVKAALQAGKHVLCEKPLTSDGPQAWELDRLAREKNLKLMVGHVFLFNPGIEYLANTLREEPVGPVFYMNAVRTNLGPFRYDVNAAWDLASHDIYIFNHLLRERPVSVSASGGRYLQQNLEDIVFLTLEYPSGVLGQIHVSWLDPKKVRQITVVTEKKMITWDDLGVPGPITIYDRTVEREPVYETFGEFQLLAREGDVVLPRVSAGEPLGAQAKAFIAAVRGESVDAGRGSAAQGAEVVDILGAMDQSMSGDGRRVEVAYGG